MANGNKSFWNQPTSDPKRKFRWYLTFTSPQDPGNTLYLAAKTIDKPKFEISNTQHQFINHQFNFPGRLKWEPLAATFVDLASSPAEGGSDIGRIISGMIDASGYRVPEGNPDNCKFSITKDQAVAAFGSNFEIIQMDGDNKVVEKWKLANPWISQVQYGDLSYEDDGLVEISVTIVYDWAQREV